MLGLYTLAIHFYAFLARIAAWFNRKAALWVAGRKDWKQALKTLDENEGPVWFHCASVGEFEQARPVIELLRKEAVPVKIVITFFSPSGYEVRKNYPLADVVTYLPADTKKNARQFLDALKPRVALFVKYDFWFNFMQEMHDRVIPSAVVSAYIPGHHWLLKWPGSLFVSRLGQFDRLFLQDTGSAEHLSRFNLRNTTVCGDTRVDRVLAGRQEPFQQPQVEEFCKGKKVLVIGSNWPADDAVILPALQEFPDDVKIIVAPHEMNESQWVLWNKTFEKNIVRWSELSAASLNGKKVLYVDTIGVLSKLYRFATVAFVGGGFSSGLHNTLEAAVYEIPVLFGPNNQRFLEAQQLKAIGVGFEVRDTHSFKQKSMELMGHSDGLNVIAVAAKRFFNTQQGASVQVLEWIKHNL